MFSWELHLFTSLDYVCEALPLNCFVDFPELPFKSTHSAAGPGQHLGV